MNQAINDFINGKRIAVVGVSRNAKKFGNAIYTELKQRGYQVFAVNPSINEIAGDPCYPNLKALQGKIDGVLVCVPSSKGETVLREAAELGLHNVWLQQGADSPKLIKLGSELGLNMVSRKCILMYAPPVRSFHKFHRAIAKLFSQL